MYKVDVSKHVIQISHLVQQLAKVETAEARFFASRLLNEEVVALDHAELAEVVAIMSLCDLEEEPRQFQPPHARFIEKEGRVHAVAFRRAGDEFNVIVELPDFSSTSH